MNMIFIINSSSIFIIKHGVQLGLVLGPKLFL